MAVLALVATGLFGPADPAQAAPPPTDYRSFPGCPLLIENFSGDCVTKMQHELNVVFPGYNLAEDGKFGPLTRIAVLDFQGRNHLPADGNFGGITADELQKQYDAKQPPAPAPGSPEYCLNAGKVSDGQGGCMSDGVVGGGKSLTTCLREAAIDKATSDVLQRAFTTGKFSSWAEALPTVEKIAPWVDAAKAFKCGWWDLPE